MPQPYIQIPTSGRAAEEAEIKEEYQTQIAAAEETARATYEKELAAKIAGVRAKYGAMIESEKAQYDLEVMIAKASEAERAKFLKSITSQRKQIETGYQKKVVTTRKVFKRKVQAGIQEAKRVAAREAKTYAAVSPRMLRAYRRTEFEIFEEAVMAETEVFEKEVKTWKERAVGEYETGLKKWKVEELGKQEKAMKAWEAAERETLESEIVTYKKEAAAGIEAQMKEWKKEEVAQFEPQLEKWREAWKPKSYAEQMLEWKAPDLPKIDIELFKMPVKGGYLRIGFDIGKFAEGLAEGSVAAGAGVVASGESLAYSIGSLAGIETPRPPPTLVGGLIQSVPESIGAGQLKPSPALEKMAEQKYAFTYAAATLLGDVIISYGIGKGVEAGAVVIGKTRVGAYVGLKMQPILRPIAKFQYKLGKVAEPVTKRMVKAAEWVVSPIYKAKAVSLVAKAPAAAVPRRVLLDLTKPAKAPAPISLVESLAVKKWTVRAMRWQLGAGVLPTTADDLAGLPKKFSEYVRPVKLPTPPREGIVIQAGRQALIMEKPLLKLLPKVTPQVRIFKWVVKAQKETLKTALLAKAIPALKPAEATLAAVLGLKAVAPVVSLKQEIRQAVKQQEKQRQKVKVSLIPIQLPALAPALVPVQIPELKQPVLEKTIQQMKQEQIQRQKQQEKEERRLRKKKEKMLKPWKRRGALFEYPVRLEKEVPSFLFKGLGKKSQGINLSSAIFGKKRRRKKK